MLDDPFDKYRRRDAQRLEWAEAWGSLCDRLDAARDTIEELAPGASVRSLDREDARWIRDDQWPFDLAELQATVKQAESWAASLTAELAKLTPDQQNRVLYNRLRCWTVEKIARLQDGNDQRRPAPPKPVFGVPIAGMHSGGIAPDPLSGTLYHGQRPDPVPGGVRY